MSRSGLFYIKTIGISVIAVLIVGYSLFSARHLIEGPRISLVSPSNGQIFTDPLIQIDGVAKNIAFISLNDRPIFIDEQGNIKEKLLLTPGYNIIKLYARDKFSREVIKHLEVVLNEAVTFPIIPVVSPSLSTPTTTASSSSTF